MLIQPIIKPLVRPIAAPIIGSSTNNFIPIVRSDYLNPVFTTSRASAGWALDGALLREYGNNVPRLTSGGLTEEGQATNFIWPARDLTHANWSKSGITAVRDATGIDGVASTASRLTCTSAFGQVGEYGATSTNTTHAHSMFMRRRTGTGPVYLNLGRTTGGAGIGSNTVQNGDMSSATGWSGLGGFMNISGGLLTKSGGTSSLATTPTMLRPYVTGAAYLVTTVVASVTQGSVTIRGVGGTTPTFGTYTTPGTYQVIVVFQADITALNIRFPTDTIASVSSFVVQPYCEPALTLTSEWQRITPVPLLTPSVAPNPTVLFVMTANGDEIDVDVVGAEVGSFPTSPIITTSGAVTRLRDAISGPSAPFNTTGGGAFYGRVTIPALLTGAILGMNDGTNSNRWLVETNFGGLFNINRITGGASSTTGNAAGQSYTAGVSFGIAIRFASDGIISLSVNGANHAFRTGAPLPPVYNNIILGEAMFGIWHQLRFRPGVVSDAELRALSTFVF